MNRILRQAESNPEGFFRVAALQWNAPDVGGGNKSGLLHARGSSNSYIIEQPGHNNAPAGGFLLHHKPNAELGTRSIWNFHSGHDSVESAQAAAERHDAGGG